jgi:hypothetical protein
MCACVLGCARVWVWLLATYSKTSVLMCNNGCGRVCGELLGSLFRVEC